METKILIIPYGRQQLEMLYDEDDAWLVEKFNWTIASTKGLYAITRVSNNIYRFHRLVTNCTDADLVVDHINGDTLDNRKVNLRICTPGENSRNRRNAITNKNGYKGVTIQKKSYNVTITYKGKSYSHEVNSLLDAAELYDMMAIHYHGEFASLNFPDKIYTTTYLEWKEQRQRMLDERNNKMESNRQMYDNFIYSIINEFGYIDFIRIDDKMKNMNIPNPSDFKIYIQRRLDKLYKLKNTLNLTYELDIYGCRYKKYTPIIPV